MLVVPLGTLVLLAAVMVAGLLLPVVLLVMLLVARVGVGRRLNICCAARLVVQSRLVPCAGSTSVPSRLKAWWHIVIIDLICPGPPGGPRHGAGLRRSTARREALASVARTGQLLLACFGSATPAA
jgi:hypothetical protein